MTTLRRSCGTAPQRTPALGLAAAMGFAATLGLAPGGRAWAFVPVDPDALAGTSATPAPVDAGPSATAAGTDAASTGATGTGLAGTGLAGTGAPQVRLGALGLVTDGLPAPAPGDPTARGYTITPSIGLQLLATDNVYQVSSPRRADFITQISPGIVATAETARLRAAVGYAPLIQLYAVNGSQSGVDHVGNGQALLEVVPGLVFLDVRGATTVQSSRGGFQPQGTAVQDRRDLVQSTSLQVSPYLVKRFGGDATLVLGYAFQYSNQDGNQSALLGSNQAYFTGQSFTAHEGLATLSTGENFGRFALEGRVDGTTYSGTGVLSGAHRAYASVEGRYAFFRGVAGLAEVGYEDQEYGGVPRVRISDPIWAVGVRLTPAPDSIILAKYGHRDGYNAGFLDAGFNIGPRTRVFANYTDQLQTVAQQGQDLLSTAAVDASGNLVSASTRAPVFFGSSTLAVQDGLFRTRRATASVTHFWQRDSVTLSVFYERRTPVSAQPGVFAFEQSGYSGSVSWAHELGPDTTSFASLQYGTTSQQRFGSQDVFTVSLALSQQLGRDLNGSLQYVLTNRQGGLLTNRTAAFGGGFDTGTSLQNVVIASLRKSF